MEIIIAKLADIGFALFIKIFTDYITRVDVDIPQQNILAIGTILLFLFNAIICYLSIRRPDYNTLTILKGRDLLRVQDQVNKALVKRSTIIFGLSSVVNLGILTYFIYGKAVPAAIISLLLTLLWLSLAYLTRNSGMTTPVQLLMRRG
ncbi:hypothetical protein [Limisalsivibrio acetivorans]|uniref:hypothetical protein n=1 Tax=Limisalsivibrio acetivorans TaxID=1304888 RepID=UPI0003B38427|nr:hypothetical protein [Limisalsivibrio acetivorans]